MRKTLSGNKIGVVFGSFAPLHQGHLDLIMQAKKENDGGCIVLVCGYDGDKGEPLMPQHKRYRYVREYFADDELVAVYSINDTEREIPQYPDGWTKWLQVFAEIFEEVYAGDDNALAVTNWYVGDKPYYNYLKSIGYNATLVDRKENPISGTMIRDNPSKYWDKIAFPFRRLFSINILIMGCPSEGKTTMVKDLGKYFNAPYSYEYARNYMEESNIGEDELDGADFFALLQGQYALNKKLINSRANQGFFFADSDSIVTQSYAELYAKDTDCKVSEEELDEIIAIAEGITARCKWDKIYVLAPHGKFVDDNVRLMKYSGLDERWRFFGILSKNLVEASLEHKAVVLEGGYWDNFKRIVDDVKEAQRNGYMA